MLVMVMVDGEEKKDLAQMMIKRLANRNGKKRITNECLLADSTNDDDEPADDDSIEDDKDGNEKETEDDDN